MGRLDMAQAGNSGTTGAEQQPSSQPNSPALTSSPDATTVPDATNGTANDIHPDATTRETRHQRLAKLYHECNSKKVLDKDLFYAVTIEWKNCVASLTDDDVSPTSGKPKKVLWTKSSNKSAFNTLDNNKDGSISAEEFIAYHHQVFEKLADPEFEAACNSIKDTWTPSDLQLTSTDNALGKAQLDASSEAPASVEVDIDDIGATVPGSPKGDDKKDGPRANACCAFHLVCGDQNGQT